MVAIRPVRNLTPDSCFEYLSRQLRMRSPNEINNITNPEIIRKIENIYLTINALIFGLKNFKKSVKPETSATANIVIKVENKTFPASNKSLRNLYFENKSECICRRS